MQKLLKGILVWVTMVVTISVGISIDCLFEDLCVGLLSVLSVVVLITLCYKFVSVEEFMELSGCNFLNKRL